MENIGEKSCLKKCCDCGKFFHFLEGDKWCEDCFDKGLVRDMNEHFNEFVKREIEEMNEPQPSEASDGKV